MTYRFRVRAARPFRRLALLAGGLTMLACSNAPVSTGPVPQADAFLDDVQERTFRWFWDTTNPQNGLTPDTVLTGGVCIDGIVVGASGAFPVYDEMFAGTLAVCLRALARQARMAEAAGVALDVPRE